MPVIFQDLPISHGQQIPVRERPLRLNLYTGTDLCLVLRSFTGAVLCELLGLKKCSRWTPSQTLPHLRLPLSLQEDGRGKAEFSNPSPARRVELMGNSK